MHLERLFVVALLASVCLGSGATAAEVGIDHDGRECFLRGSYPVVDASMGSPERIKTAKVYFRAEQFVDFYWVEMQVMEGRFVGVLPQPSADTHRIFYYIEALDYEFYGVRDAGHDPEVRVACELPDDAVYVPGDDPSIVVGATSLSGPSLPPGFQAAGIAGFMSAAGISSGIGGGVGAGTAVVIGASVAGAVGGAAVAVSGGSDERSGEAPERTRPVGDATTTVPVATTTVPISVGTTTTVPPGVTTTVAPGVTTTVTAGGTTTVPPGGTTTIPTTTTTTPTTTTIAAPGPSACFVYDAKLGGSCHHSWEAWCSTGSIDTYEWVIDTTAELPAGTFTRVSGGPVLNVNWGAMGGCPGNPSITIQLTVHGPGGSDTTTQSGFVINQRTHDRPEPLRARLRSRLSSSAPNDPARGMLRLGPTRLEPVDGTRDFEHIYDASEGRNVIEATLTAGAGGETTWEFDFSQEPNVVRGSVRASVGDVIVRSDRRLVFRMTGRASERVRFTYRLAR